MSINRKELSMVLNALDDINRISELQELLQAVVSMPDVTSEKYHLRVQLMSELFLTHSTPLL